MKTPMKTLQKLLVLIIAISFIACSTDDANEGVLALNETTSQFELWNAIDLVTTVNGADLDEEVIARFSDGTVTKDLENVFQSNVKDLRKDHPSLWGISRIVDEQLEIQWDDEEQYESFYSTFKLNTVPNAYTFKGCFKITGGVSTGIGFDEIHSFSLKKIFFETNGRFSFESFVAIGGGGTNGFSASPELNGTYTIEGNKIEMVYDDGKSLTTTFGVNEEVSYIALGDTVYYNCN